MLRGVRVLIFHGYLLAGTGSNVYNSALAEALVRAGHEVHLLSQERDPLALEWVDAAGDWDGGRLELTTRREPVRATVYRPDIGGLLPVYVADRYEGVEARAFPELSEAEVERYVEANVAAVREVAARARPDVALANHLVMGPAILARALDDVPYAVKIHGSALEYTVKPHPRFLAVRARGPRARPRDPRRLAPHRREPVGGDGRPDGRRPHAPRAAGRRRRALRATHARRGARRPRAPPRPPGGGRRRGW